MADDHNKQDSKIFKRAFNTLGAVVFTGLGAYVTAIGMYSLVTGKGRDKNFFANIVKEGNDGTRFAGGLSALMGVPVLREGIDALFSKPWERDTNVSAAPINFMDREQGASRFVEKVESSNRQEGPDCKARK